eukprot:TRINITY_DN20870_c0_g1_i2.p1 TRINITY_DN20870_c0_g1~~TRINITY_DN20870_c0_g1_i2.p1  ORF type:complete len:235 (-),score=50.22 TRINITY_DN20870_c0_g1_i2:117-821(-)
MEGCFQCRAGSFSEASGETSCQLCPRDESSPVGSASGSDCAIEPALLAAQVDYNKQLAEEQEKIRTISIACGAGLVLAVSVLAVMMHINKQRKHKLELALAAAELQVQEALVREQNDEIHYLKNWHINESDIVLETEIAKGSQGTVWIGELQGRKGKVAIKVNLGPGNEVVWKEAEVAFMMSMPHPRLVEFIGAGEMAVPQLGHMLLFNVQEYMSGGSIETVLWGTQYLSLIHI